MKFWITLLPCLCVNACAFLPATSTSCMVNPTENSKICTITDSSQNLTTRTIEKAGKLFVSTCSNGACSEFKEMPNLSK